jgi:adenosine deaminase
MAGVFDCSLSGEYRIVADTFGLSPRDMLTASQRAIEFIFADDAIKSKLRDAWNSFAAQNTVLLA